MLDTSATWQDTHFSDNLSTDFSGGECYRYRLGEDSLVNDTSYKMLYRSGTFAITHNHPPYGTYVTTYSNSFAALLREDTVQRRIFIRLEYWPAEMLLYDFSVGVGPYPETYLYGNMSGLQVVAVDTRILSDGPHRGLILNTGDTLVEGVGSLLHGFVPAQGVQGNFWYEHLVCHSVHEVPNYEDLTDIYCVCGFILGIEASTTNGPRVGPSPTVDRVNVYDAPALAHIRVWTMDGRVVNAGMCDQSGNAAIDLTGLPAALYVVEIRDDHMHRFNVKVVKE